MIADMFFQNILQGSESLEEVLSNVDAMYNSLDPAYDNGISSECFPAGTRIDVQMDLPLLEELEQLSLRADVAASVRADFRCVRVVLRDDEDRLHEACVERGAADRYSITDTSIPHAAYRDTVYPSLVSAVEAFREAVASLQAYFRELQRLDANCWVVDPPRPSFKDDYRRIVLEERAWLHVEVTADGGAARMRVLGGGAAAAHWSGRLAARLHAWTPARDVLANLMTLLDIDEFPQPPPDAAPDSSQPAAIECAICLCAELPGVRGCPQPICANAKCGSYYHAGCLYLWLLASAGGAAPRLGVLSGKCPNCLSPISCSEHDT